MDHFQYRNNEIFAEDIAVREIAEKYQTPFYLYSEATIKRHFSQLADNLKLKDKLICYALKANANIHVLKLLNSLGSGADVVSAGEIKRAREAGIPADKIVYSGVGKTKAEIAYAIDTKILQFNVESYEEAEIINEIAASKEVKQNIVLRINPDIDAETNDKISTGRKGDKFGVDIDYALAVIEKILNFKNINFTGISVHIGSQITDLKPFSLAFRKTVDFVKDLMTRGIKISVLDFGGGIGVPYNGNKTISLADYGQLISEVTADLPDIKYIFEPGRLIMANAGILVTSVILVKNTPYKKFAIIDAAMNDLLRPALYAAEHNIEPVSKNNDKLKETYDIVGPVCETSDIFSKDINFQKLNPDDLLIIRSTGAYGAVMSSTYNLRPLIKEFLIKNDQIFA